MCGAFSGNENNCLNKIYKNLDNFQFCSHNIIFTHVLLIRNDFSTKQLLANYTNIYIYYIYNLMFVSPPLQQTLLVPSKCPYIGGVPSSGEQIYFGMGGASYVHNVVYMNNNNPQMPYTIHICVHCSTTVLYKLYTCNK